MVPLKALLPLEMDIEILGLYSFGVQGVDFCVFGYSPRTFVSTVFRYSL